MKNCRLLVLCLLVLFVPRNIFAQTENATITGRITDPAKATIVGAEVSVVNTGTNVRYQGITNSAGSYVIAGIAPGPYRIEVGKVGFKTIVETSIVLHVQDTLELNFEMALGAVSESVTVNASDVHINTQDAAVSTVIDRNFVESLPLNGRSFNTLLELTPGVVIAASNSSSPGQFSIAGQRTDANNFTLDGVSANFGVGSSLRFGGSGTGTAQAFSALGGTSSLVSVEALQEFRIETSSFAPEFGRSPGGQVILTTRSGTNDFHGGVYEYFRNTVMDANNWFNDAATPPIPRAPEHHNDFGGYLGGRIFKDKTFFFVSYEGARLGQPSTFLTSVPSTFARTQAPTTLAPFLNAFPLPNGQPTSPTAYIAPYTQSVSNTAMLDAGSIRIDHTFSGKFYIFGRYNDAPSQFVQTGFNPTTTETNTQTMTIGVNMQFSNRIVNTLRGNYSTQDSRLANALNTVDGAVPLNPALLLGTLPSTSTFIGGFGTADTNSFAIGTNADNRTRQLNFVDDLSWSLGKHQVKFGGDYRAIYLDKKPFQNELIFSAPTVQDFLSTPTVGQMFLTPVIANHAKFLTQALSLYGQDSWKITPRLTLTYGLRWELSPAPSARGKTTLAAWTDVNNPAALALAAPGTPLWNTTYGNFAPRAGIAYNLTDKGDFVVRAGGGVFYDLGVGQAVQLANSFPNFAFGNLSTVSVPLTDAKPFLPSLSSQPPFAGVEAYSPDLKLPRSYQWNVALEKSFGGQQAISATYVGQAGRDLLRQGALFQPNPNFTGDFLLWQGDAFSNYHALQLQYRRPLSSRVQALLNYTWSHSLDNASNDVVAGLSNTVISAARDYASSDFDVRQSFSGAITYAIPGVSRYRALSLLTKDWSVNTVIVARNGFPFNAFLFLESADPGFGASTRPDLVPGQRLWTKQPSAPGGKILNANAFVVPAPLAQGTEGRNDIPGFGLTQVDLSIVRKFSITESVHLQFRADAFNLFNHPNFTNPNGFFEFGAFGLQSPSMLNQGLGGLNPLFQEGGPRSLQLSLILSF